MVTKGEIRVRARQRFLQILMLVIVLLVGVSFVPLLPAEAAGSPDHVTLTWTADPKTTQTITWRTGSTTVGGQVEYAEANNVGLFPGSARTVTAGITALQTNLGDMAIHSATLIGLKPGTKYIYRVGGADGWSDPRTFTTEVAVVSGFKFLVFGDSQSVNYGLWRATLTQAYKANDDAVFFTNVGDLVDVGQDYSHWNRWFDAAEGVADTIAVMPITGNHENYTPERRFSLPVFFTDQFKLPPNGPAGLVGQVYSFDYGDAHFVMLDSQEGEQREFIPDMLSIQRAWLEQDLGGTNKKWKIVFVHRPLYNNKPGATNTNIQKAFSPVFDKYHVDVVFTGHDHTYARTYPLYGDMATDSAATGTVYVASGRSGAKVYSNTIAKEWNKVFYNPWDEPNYITVEVSGDVLVVKSFKQSGALIDAWSITKSDK